jgi:hypothetical protein
MMRVQKDSGMRLEGVLNGREKSGWDMLSLFVLK